MPAPSGRYRIRWAESGKFKMRWAESGNSRIMNPPQERIDQFWIRQTEEIIASAVRKIQDQVGRVRKIQDQVGRVRNAGS